MSIFNKIKNFKLFSKIKGMSKKNKIIAGSIAGVMVLSGGGLGVKNLVENHKNDTNNVALEATTEPTETTVTTPIVTDPTETTEAETTTTLSSTTETTVTTTYDADSLFKSDELEEITINDDVEVAEYKLGEDVVAVDESGNNISNIVSNGETEIVEKVEYSGDFYVAPNGKVYESKEDYDRLISGNQEVSNSDSSAYKGADGNYYASEEDYNRFVNGGETYSTPSEESVGGDIQTDSGYYYDEAAGIFWDSYEDYALFYNASYSMEQTEIEYQEESSYNTEDSSFFVGPDKQVYASEEDYNRAVGIISEQDTNVEPSAPVEEKEEEKTNEEVSAPVEEKEEEKTSEESSAPVEEKEEEKTSEESSAPVEEKEEEKTSEEVSAPVEEKEEEKTSEEPSTPVEEKEEEKTNEEPSTPVEEKEEEKTSEEPSTPVEEKEEEKTNEEDPVVEADSDDIESGKITEDEPYLSPEGDWWTSKEEYDNYMNSLVAENGMQR